MMDPEDRIQEKKSELHTGEILKKKLPDFLSIGGVGPSGDDLSGNPSRRSMSRRLSLGQGPLKSLSPFTEDVQRSKRRNTFMPEASDRRTLKFSPDHKADTEFQQPEQGHTSKGRIEHLQRGNDVKADIFFRKDIFNPKFGNPTDGASCLS